jgi:hypothetical protein
VRWRIGMADGSPLAIAGLWREWKDQADGSTSASFTMLTVNADEHPLMKRFHRPGAEKRSVVIIPPTAYEDWLSCKSTDEARSGSCSFIRLTRCTASLFHCRRGLPSRSQRLTSIWLKRRCLRTTAAERGPAY